MILPTRADCSPFAVAEASAHGLPSLIADTGGVRGVLFDGENGGLMPAGASAAEWSGRILDMLADGASYRELCRTSRRLYEERLNWGAWARAIAALAGFG
jgi:glycosyltransferase involved in cell wall biosynthesis